MQARNAPAGNNATNTAKFSAIVFVFFSSEVRENRGPYNVRNDFLSTSAPCNTGDDRPPRIGGLACVYAVREKISSRVSSVK